MAYYKHYRKKDNIDGIVDMIFKPIIKAVKPQIKGFMGEFSINLLLGFLDSSKYKALSNIIIQSGSHTTQIDHILVSNYGIFVIETKNYKGLIFGDERSQYWTQVLYSSKNKLYNPIRQNKGHIKALKENLHDAEIPIYSYVVFSTDAELKVKDCSNIGHPWDLLTFIKQHRVEMISDKDKELIFNNLLSLKEYNKQLSREHVESVQEKQNDVKKKVVDNVCPQYGGTLVKRNGKYGSFKGCSNYPRCKFTAK